MLIVQKYGGSSVANAERVFNVAKRILATQKEGNDVVVVLSAQGKTTDGLIAKAKEINPKASRREMAVSYTHLNGYAAGNWGTAVCSTDGNGDQCAGRQSRFPQCRTGRD